MKKRFCGKRLDLRGAGTFTSAKSRFAGFAIELIDYACEGVFARHISAARAHKPTTKLGNEILPSCRIAATAFLRPSVCCEGLPSFFDLPRCEGHLPFRCSRWHQRRILSFEQSAVPCLERGIIAPSFSTALIETRG